MIPEVIPKTEVMPEHGARGHLKAEVIPVPEVIPKAEKQDGPK